MSPIPLLVFINIFVNIIRTNMYKDIKSFHDDKNSYPLSITMVLLKHFRLVRFWSEKLKLNWSWSGSIDRIVKLHSMIDWFWSVDRRF